MSEDLHNQPFPYARAICYSGFRDGQNPGNGTFPSYDEVKEDLTIIQQHWQYIRLYDCGDHARTTLEVISKEGIDLKVYLGAYILAEENNPDCPWNPPKKSTEQLARNKAYNRQRVEDMIKLSEEFTDIVIALSVGNEATVAWTDHQVSVDSVIEYLRLVKSSSGKPVSFCENYVPWTGKLDRLVAYVNFISLHTYPVWEYRSIDQALEYTIQNYRAVAQRFPDIPIVIAEAGWATRSNGRGIDPENVNETFQKTYFDELMKWADTHQITTFFFEAFDENWKGSSDELEPEKHWGVFFADRTPKLVMH